LAAAPKIDPSAGAHSHSTPRLMPSVLRCRDHFTSFDAGLEPAVSVSVDGDRPQRKSEGFNGFLERNFRIR
jgi:hypothetical protein